MHLKDHLIFLLTEEKEPEVLRFVQAGSVLMLPGSQNINSVYRFHTSLSGVGTCPHSLHFFHV